MRIVLHLFRWVSALLLHTSIFLVIGAFSFVFLIGDQQVIKDVLVESQIYEKFVPSIIDANVAESERSPNSLPLEDPEIQKIVNSAFSPAVLRGQTDEVIDDIYKWLDGTHDELAFSYDFSAAKAEMNTGIADYAANRVLSLNECETALNQINVFDVSCRPAGFTYDFVRSQVLNDLQSSDFLEDPIVDQADLPKSSDGQALQDRYSFIPSIYQILGTSIYLSIGLMVVFAAIFVYLRRPLNKGFQALGRDLFSNGVMIIILTVVFGFLLPQFTNAFGIEGNEASTLFNDVADIYVNRFDILVINVAIQIAAIGLAIFLIARINKSIGTYRDAHVKSGVISSVGTQQRGGQVATGQPPIQTSEQGVPAKTTTKKPRKYRKIGL